ncbi:7531_t:CDS:2 [Diversispora eburnea]|uniref:7531_t:CDS:1 n=1 Tax=Diversispora eburnea TaxID=1213867 RepID=A0A9N9BK20_9GLOM|nr:7531_t:CDS:2 [Diversispora eburnea]
MDNNNNQNRACLFVTQSPSLCEETITNETPFIKVPFPPMIDPKDLIIMKPNEDKPARSPNSFIIYRKVFVEAARDSGYYLPMTVISSMASNSWDNESDEVKAYYKRLSKEAFEYRSEKYPKNNKRRKRKAKWNVLAFDYSNKQSNRPNKQPKNNQNNQNEIVTMADTLFTPTLPMQFETTNSFELQNVYPNILNTFGITEFPSIEANFSDILTNSDLLAESSNPSQIYDPIKKKFEKY